MVGRFQSHLHGYNIGTWWRADLVLVTLTYFSRSLQDLNCQIWAKRCLCAQYLMNQLADFNQICMDKHLDIIKSWIGFGDLDLIFKVTARHNPPKLSQTNVCLHVISWTIGWNVTKFANLYQGAWSLSERSHWSFWLDIICLGENKLGRNP